MKRLILTWLVAGGMLLASTMPAEAFEIGARALYWFPGFKADMKSDSAGVTGSSLNLKDNLGVGNESLPTFEAFGGLGKHRITLGYTPIAYSGATTLSGPVTFRGQTFAAGSRVETDLKLRMLDLEYQYTFLDLENILAGFSLGLIGQIKYLDGEAKLRGANQQADTTTRLALPLVGMGAHAGLLAGILEARARIAGIGWSGNYLYEALADLSWTPFPFLDVHGGYKIIRVRLDRNDDFLDAQFAGPYLGLTVSF